MIKEYPGSLGEKLTNEEGVKLTKFDIGGERC